MPPKSTKDILSFLRNTETHMNPMKEMDVMLVVITANANIVN